jgi:DNA replication protein DnaC
MSTANTVDTARINLLLNELRLPAIKVLWSQFAEQSDKEGWTAARFLAAIAEHEIAERGRRRIERHLIEARLPSGKTFDSFDFEAVPMISKAQVTALAAGDGWLGKGANLLLFGPPGGGKSHLAAALGLALIENGWRVLFTRTTDLVQKLQVARRELNLEAAINRLDRFDLLVLDDLAYVTKDQAETSVLFELISARYERLNADHRQAGTTVASLIIFIVVARSCTPARCLVSRRRSSQPFQPPAPYELQLPMAVSTGRAQRMTTLSSASQSQRQCRRCLDRLDLAAERRKLERRARD